MTRYQTRYPQDLQHYAQAIHWPQISLELLLLFLEVARVFSESKNLLRGRRWPHPPSALSGSGGYRGVLLSPKLHASAGLSKKKRRGPVLLLEPLSAQPRPPWLFLGPSDSRGEPHGRLGRRAAVNAP